MDRDVVSMSIAHNGWSRFNHARVNTGEAQSGIFEPAMTESRLLDYDKMVIRIVDVSESQ